jgi:UDP-N-acetylmuramate dehydrogenase
VAITLPLDQLRAEFGSQLQENVVLANYVTARIGGACPAMLIVHTARDLEKAATTLWQMDIPFYLLGSGSNVLVSDSGVDAVILLNRAHMVKIDTKSDPPSVWAESGANLGGIARQVVLRGLGGLEWAAHIPGTIGGAVYGNAGAHGSDINTNFILAEILHRESGKAMWQREQMEYSYRTSILKRQPGKAVILSARLALTRADPAEVQARMDEYAEKRKRIQPQGPSSGSTFKNPPGEAAGRLIEAAGLKGVSIGGVQVSPIHGNFFINKGNATAQDYYRLIQLVRQKVYEKFNIQLELEVELLGFPQDIVARHENKR